jgi:hypothetical protein
MEELYKYFMHYNSFTETWNAVPRELASQYLNGTLSEEDVLKNKDIKILINYICKSATKK